MTSARTTSSARTSPDAERTRSAPSAPRATTSTEAPFTLTSVPTGTSTASRADRLRRVARMAMLSPTWLMSNVSGVDPSTDTDTVPLLPAVSSTLPAGSSISRTTC